MQIELYMRIVPTIIMMIIWLLLVFVTMVSAYGKTKSSEGLERKQYLYIAVMSILVILGDSLHTVADTLRILTGDPTGPIAVLGGTYPLRTFAMFFDTLMFMLFYLLWHLIVVARYEEGKMQRYDQAVIGLAVLGIITVLPTALVDIFPLEYTISIIAPHNLLFMAFGALFVIKLIQKSREQLTAHPESKKERALQFIGISFVFSFIFYFLTLALLPVSTVFGYFMIPKTVAYLVAYYFILTGVVRSA